MCHLGVALLEHVQEIEVAVVAGRVLVRGLDLYHLGRGEKVHRRGPFVGGLEELRVGRVPKSLSLQVALGLGVNSCTLWSGHVAATWPPRDRGMRTHN